MRLVHLQRKDKGSDQRTVVSNLTLKHSNITKNNRNIFATLKDILSEILYHTKISQSIDTVNDGP